MPHFARDLKRLFAIPIALIGTVFLSIALNALPATLEEATE